MFRWSREAEDRSNSDCFALSTFCKAWGMHNSHVRHAQSMQCAVCMATAHGTAISETEAKEMCNIKHTRALLCQICLINAMVTELKEMRSSQFRTMKLAYPMPFAQRVIFPQEQPQLQSETHLVLGPSPSCSTMMSMVDPAQPPHVTHIQPSERKFSLLLVPSLESGSGLS